MQYKEAETIIRNALWCVQKVRSISEEQAENDPTMYRVQRFLEPKIHDDRWMLNPLLKMVERMDGGGAITPQEFYNMMFIIDRWAESVQVSYILATENINGFPIPDIQWRRGWEQEVKA